MLSRLSETDRAKGWLDQFIEVDQELAKLFLDSLTLISTQELIRELENFILTLANSKVVEKPIALIPVREMAPHQSYYHPATEREAKPNLLLKNSFPGSEAIIASILAKAIRGDVAGNIFVFNPSLRNMRASKCRTVLFIDDFIGSGERVKNFLLSYQRHITTRSWKSGKLIKYLLMAYSTTETGLKNINHSKYSLLIHYLRKCPSFEEQPWTSRQRRMIIQLCIDKSPGLVGEMDMSLGFQNTMGTLVFEHSVPNNTPSMLWHGNKSWQPLFPGRTVPLDLVPTFKFPDINEFILQKLKSLGQKRLAKGLWLPLADPYVKKIILVLSTVSKKARNYYQIADHSNLSTLESENIVKACMEWDLIDDKFRLTSAGRSELEHARKLRIEQPLAFKSPEGYYFPRNLRRAQ